uniref:Calpain catalytic domain-containing protein n=1 Tax=Globisporangium ultimum (strain ATCC 200006 / CBS 805.95 / DAOM BR144) TaxID=431595 RepID=K3WE14_GLOUD
MQTSASRPAPVPSIVKTLSSRGKDESRVASDLARVKLQKEARTIIATAGRDLAIEECRRKVAKISRECRMKNIKYRDPHFDLSVMQDFCLNGLRQKGEGLQGVAAPGTVRRVEDVYDNPRFIVDGIAANDIKQGALGDCWFLAALATIANVPRLLESICVARDEQVGVYGFIFFRDGDWISEVIDDQLYIANGDYAEADATMRSVFPTEEEYVKAIQKGSTALHFAKCADSNETWLPLLEKAFAKAHGDYSAIEGGFTGEGVEDLTGGVTTEIITRDILDKNRLWNEELTKVNDELLFACGITNDTLDQVRGIITNHAYSVLKAVEANGQRLVKVRNPWGKSEWTGPWSDGSPEWTPEWMTLLDHRFGDDGAFWMSYEDFLKVFTDLDRTRIFTPEWTVAQCWTQGHVTWPAQFADQEFKIALKHSSTVAIVLQQVDQRYFSGLEGQYDFRLYFRLRREGETEYFARSTQGIIMTRSVNIEVDLDAGNWFVSFKVSRVKSGRATRDEYIEAFRKGQSDKFMHIARSFDFAFSKGNEEWFDGITTEPEEEEDPEQAEAEPEQKPIPVSELDTTAVIGLLVYAKDPSLAVQLVDADPSVNVLDPDDSSVQFFLEGSHDKSNFLSAHIASTTA